MLTTTLNPLPLIRGKTVLCSRNSGACTCQLSPTICEKCSTGKMCVSKQKCGYFMHSLTHTHTACGSQALRRQLPSPHPTSPPSHPLLLTPPPPPSPPLLQSSSDLLTLSPAAPVEVGIIASTIG